MKTKSFFEEQIKALSEISKAITSDLYLEDILRLIVSVTAQVMGSNICSLMLFNEKGDELVIRATQSINEEYNKKTAIKNRRRNSWHARVQDVQKKSGV